MSIWKRIRNIVQESWSGEERDYTVGSMRRAVVLLAIPMILELSLESIFAVVDMFFVGRLGPGAVATVGLTESMITIVYSVAIGLSTAAGALVSRRVGEKNMSAASHAGAQSLVLSFLLTILLSLGGIIYAGDLLKIMGAEPQVVKEGTWFARIMLGGSTAIVWLFLINGIFRGAGMAAMAMKSLWLASGLNIVLCPLFIYGLNWGLNGAAIATTVGRATGVLYQIYQIRKPSSRLQWRWSHFRPRLDIMSSVFRLAWPATFQFIIASASWIVMARFVAETGGTLASAGYQIAIRNLVFFILPAWGLSNAAATLVGQNLGAKQERRAAQSVRICVKYNMLFMCLVTILFVFLPERIASIYTSHPIVLATAVKALRIMGTGFIFYGMGMVMMQALNGAGDTRTPTWIHFIGFWLFQIPLAYTLAYHTAWGVDGVFVAIPLAETLIALASAWYFSRGHWKKVVV